MSSVHVPGLQPRDILQLVLACWRGWLRATCPVMQILRLSRLTRYCSSGSQARLFLNHCSVPHRLLPSSVVQLLSSSAPRHHEAAALPPPPRARGPHGSGHPRQVSDAEDEGDSGVEFRINHYFYFRLNVLLPTHHHHHHYHPGQNQRQYRPPRQVRVRVDI